MFDFDLDAGRPLGFGRTEFQDSFGNAVPLAIIALLTVVFVAYNPWGWQDLLLLVVVAGLHLVPFLVLIPVTYVSVKVVVESQDGPSETAARIRSWFARSK